MSAAIEGIGALRLSDVNGMPREITALPVSVMDGGTASFSKIMMSDLNKVDHQIAAADSLVQRFALGEPIPVHQVTIALEQARISLELAMQVRSRLLEGYREIMNMQL
jgi:flagellar hook-basal body complex protein FliE